MSWRRATRGSRHDHARRLLCELTGAEDALVVNNNAAAVYLVLAALCQGREVLISRGQLVEIGGGFRIPDVLRQGGARLVEVGTTNRTHLHDFVQALTAETAAIMRVHSSNFRQLGFVTMPSLAELAALARDRGVLLIDDLGSGTLLDTTPYGLAYEPTVQESVQSGAGIVTFSGDKLLGGPQAGIILGRQPVVDQLRRHPMARALRVDKMTLAALEATLRAYRRGAAATEIPVWRMIAATGADLHSRVARWQAYLWQYGISAALWEGESAVGGGSLPGETLPTWLLAVPCGAGGQTSPQILNLAPGLTPWPHACGGARRLSSAVFRKTTWSLTRVPCCPGKNSPCWMPCAPNSVHQRPPWHRINLEPISLRGRECRMALTGGAQLVFLKLGGSLITDKRLPETPRLDVIRQVAATIAACLHREPALRLLIGHGSGSFGHVYGRRYGTARRRPDA